MPGHLKLFSYMADTLTIECYNAAYACNKNYMTQS